MLFQYYPTPIGGNLNKLITQLRVEEQKLYLRYVPQPLEKNYIDKTNKLFGKKVIFIWFYS